MSNDPSLEARAAQVVLTAISPFVVGIFTKPDSSQIGWIYGTGSAVQFDGQKLILTAAHVLPFCPSDIQFMPPPDDGFHISRSFEEQRFQKTQRYDLKSCIGDHSCDLAALLFH